MSKIYKQVSSSLIFARMYDDFNLDYNDWEHKAPEWIGQALGYMHIRTGLVPAIETKTVSQYRCHLPCPLKALDAIMYQGYRLGRGFATNDTDRNTIDDRYHPTETYGLSKNGQITTSFESGDITFYYKQLPVDCNGFPLVPDNEKVINACCWYIMKTILMRGHIHPVLTWKDAEARWTDEYPKAINSSLGLDADDRELHRELWSSLLVNPNAWKNSFFDNSASSSQALQDANTNLWTITFIANVTGYTITVSPDMPVTVDIASNKFIAARTDGNYTFLITKTGYHDYSGTITTISKNITKTIILDAI